MRNAGTAGLDHAGHDVMARAAPEGGLMDALRDARAEPVVAGRLRAWAWCIVALTCVAFALMAIEFTAAVRADRPGWWAAIQAALTSREYTLGSGSPALMYPHYRRLIDAMTVHTALGGIAMGLAVLQFMPALRRRHPRLHRAAGALVILAVFVSMLGALVYLARTPLATIYASPAFGLGLWALSLASLGYLGLAVLAIRARDFRSHMGFMALMMSTLLTAPVLRFEWALFGVLTPLDMSAVNQGVTSFLGLATILVMSLWMHQIGHADLPPRPRAAVVSPRLMRWIACAACAVIAHEALLAPAGVDLLGFWRAAHERLPAMAALWALPALALAWRAPREIAAAIAAERPTRPACALALLSAAGALAVAFGHTRHDVDAVGLVFYWGALAVITSGLVAAGWLSARRDEPWTLFWLWSALIPAAWPVLWLVAWAVGQGATIGMWFGATVGSAAFATLAFMTAFSLRVPLPAGRGSRGR